MSDKKFFSNAEVMNESELDKVAGGDGWRPLGQVSFKFIPPAKVVSTGEKIQPVND